MLDSFLQKMGYYKVGPPTELHNGAGEAVVIILTNSISSLKVVMRPENNPFVKYFHEKAKHGMLTDGRLFKCEDARHMLNCNTLAGTRVSGVETLEVPGHHRIPQEAYDYLGARKTMESFHESIS